MKEFSLKGTLFLGMLAVCFLAAVPGWSIPPGSPGQPEGGAGGSDYTHGTYYHFAFGAYEEKFHIFEPADPIPEKAPLLIFLHGWMHTEPEEYLGWIEHLCRRGWVVLFPCYQGTSDTAPRYTYNVLRTLKEGLATLYSGGHVQPDRDRVAMIGHEGGGVIAANVAATWKYFKIPRPGAIFALNPSRTGVGGSPLEIFDLSGIQEGTLFLIATGDADRPEVRETALEMFYGADNLRTRDKNYLTFLSDLHGSPPVVADKFAPLSRPTPWIDRELEMRRNEFVKLYPQATFARFTRCQNLDAMDWCGAWRLFDSLADMAFSKGSRREVFGDTPEQRFMGDWSDGKPLRGLWATDRP